MHKSHPFHVSVASTLFGFAGALALGSTAVGVFTLPSSRQFLSRHLGAHPAPKTLAFFILLFALANFKNLPLVWHFRFLRSFFYQLWLQPHPQTPRYLFAPLVTSSRNTIMDCDYNFHKSNSTYFADLDIANAHAVGLILRTGLARLNCGDQDGVPNDVIKAPGRYGLALGGVSCFFHKQIEPLQPFEIYTRLLSWDKKWMYFVSHIVRKGAIQPDRYALQPWKNSKQTGGERKTETESLKPHIFATSIAKYVSKKGRLTINPEIVLEWSRLLPCRPFGVGYPPRAEASIAPTSTEPVKPAREGEPTSTDTDRIGINCEPVKVAEVSESPLQDDSWTWEDMEKERLRGLETARHFGELSRLESELKVEHVLGRFGAYW